MKICALVPTHPHVRGSEHNSRLNVSRYFGLKIVLNEIEKAFGFVVPYVTFEEVHKYDIVLISIHSIPDFWAQAYTFYNRLKGQRKGTWIMGGSAIQNINPLVEMADKIVIGRAEHIIEPLLRSVIYGTPFSHESVVDTATYKETNQYKISYVDALYAEKLGIEKETMLGCKYNCAYCRYRIAAKPPNLRSVDKNTTMPGNEETFWELEIKNGQRHTTSLDGLTENIRLAVTKPIRNKTVVKKFKAFSEKTKTINLKIYMIVGYPGHPKLDFSELKNVFAEISKYTAGLNWHIGINLTPFSAEPGTPMQWEPVNVEVNYHKAISEYLSEHPQLHKSDGLTVLVRRQVLSNYAVLRRSVFLRSGLSDLPLIKYMAADPYFRSHNHTNTAKFEKLTSEVDVSRFTRKYEIGDVLPSSNIHSWRDQASIEKQAHTVRKKLALA